jgi:hypothetical protein
MTSRASVVEQISLDGYAVLAPDDVATALGVDLVALDASRASWSRLPRDAHLLDGGTYRSRRHSCFIHDLREDALEGVPHRAHWQSTSYNALHGGIERWFEPMEDAVKDSGAFLGVLRELGQLFAAVRAAPRWYIEAHQFRIDTASGIGRPTPEGAHRDGVDFVALLLVDRVDVRGGETRVFEAHGPTGVRFTMQDSWSALLMDDERVIHETTPIQPVEANRIGHRDTLVVTFRSGGFLGPS